MFRKPKRKGKQSFRRKPHENEEQDGSERQKGDAETVDADADADETTSELLSEARKRVKFSTGKVTAGSVAGTAATASSSSFSNAMHSFRSGKDYDDNAATTSQTKNAALATSTAQYHPEQKRQQTDGEAAATGVAAGTGEDGIFRDRHRNKFLAGPIRAAQHVRVTARFDYQPDICKDYKETGFCGFGDTCIYLHDRGDTLTGWQLEQQWEEQQKRKRERQEKEMLDFAGKHGSAGDADEAGAGATVADDGLPFACYLCRNPFDDPVVTKCQHYFCQKCISRHVRTVDETCPVCKADTHSVFNRPTKLIAKKRKVLGSSRRQDDNEDSWIAFAEALVGKPMAGPKKDDLT